MHIPPCRQREGSVRRDHVAFGNRDIPDNHAGVSGSTGQDLYSTDAWHRIMAVNAAGIFPGIKHAILMRRFAEGDDAFNAIPFVTSDESFHATGSKTHVDGDAITL